jgi:hypothetical protein
MLSPKVDKAFSKLDTTGPYGNLAAPWPITSWQPPRSASHATLDKTRGYASPPRLYLHGNAAGAMRNKSGRRAKMGALPGDCVVLQFARLAPLGVVNDVFRQCNIIHDRSLLSSKSPRDGPEAFASGWHGPLSNAQNASRIASMLAGAFNPSP